MPTCRGEKRAWSHEKPAVKVDVGWVDVSYNGLDNKVKVQMGVIRMSCKGIMTCIL